MISYISSSVILENPSWTAHVGQGRPAWRSSMGPSRNASARRAFASRGDVAAIGIDARDGRYLREAIVPQLKLRRGNGARLGTAWSALAAPPSLLAVQTRLSHAQQSTVTPNAELAIPQSDYLRCPTTKILPKHHGRFQ